MRAIILAAGRGARMGQLTSILPKPLTLYYGETLLARAVRHLRLAGIDRIAVVTGYRQEHLASYGTDHFHNPDWAETGIFWSCQQADSWLKAHECLVVYADIVFTHMDILRLCSDNHPIALGYDSNGVALWQHRFADPLEDIERLKLSDDGTLCVIGGKPHDVSEVEGQWTGIFKTTPEGWGRLLSAAKTFPESERKQLDMTSLFGAAIDAGEHLYAISFIHPWGEIDRAEDLEVMHRLYDECAFFDKP